MNKQKFIDYLRSPESLTEGQLEDLNKSLADFPYFSIGRSIAARASKDLAHDSKGALTASAAIYATDRKHLKKYISGDLVFLADVPQIQENETEQFTESKKYSIDTPTIVDTGKAAPQESEEAESTPVKESGEKKPSPSTTISDDALLSDSDFAPENLKAPTGDAMDQMLDELQHDMSELKKSRMHFADIQNQIEEEEAFSLALRRAAEKVQDTEEETSKVEKKAKESERKIDTKKEVKTESQKEEPKSKAESSKPTEGDKQKDATKSVSSPSKTSEASTETKKSAEVEREEKPFILRGIISNDDFDEEDEDESPIPLAKGKVISNDNMDDEDDEDDGEEPTSPAKQKIAIDDLAKAPDSAIQEKPETKKEEIHLETESKKQTKEIENSHPATTVTNFEIDNPDEDDNENDAQSVSDAEEEIKKEKQTGKTDSKPADKKVRQPARASRGKRQKIKREDLDMAMSAALKKEKPKKEEKTVESKAVKAKKEEKPKEEKKKTTKTTKSATKVEPKKEEKKKLEPKKKVVAKPKLVEKTPDEISKESVDKDKTAKKTTPSEELKSDTKEAENKTEEERPVRSSARAFLDYGSTGTSTSISKASSSKRKRKSSDSKSSTRATKPASKSAGTTKKGGKDDDEAGGANQLIEKFITDSPSIKRRSGTDNTSDLSQESSEWNPELASEYLAQIYLDQGNPKRAISIYETLSLKFPEKKSYFAGLIQEIKK